MSASVIESNSRLCHRGWIMYGVLLNVIIVSLPLVVTGFQNQNRLPVLLLLFGSSALCAMELNQTLRRPEHLTRVDRYRLAALIGALLLLFVQWAAIVEFETGASVGHPAGLIAGCVFIGIGAWVRSTAIQQLAAAFRSSINTSQLVTTGIYARFRHPSETGLLLAMIGFAFLLNAIWTATVLLPAAYGVARWRIHLEESELGTAFGQQYSAYAKQTSRGL